MEVLPSLIIKDLLFIIKNVICFSVLQIRCSYIFVKHQYEMRYSALFATSVKFEVIATSRYFPNSYFNTFLKS